MANSTHRRAKYAAGAVYLRGQGFGRRAALHGLEQAQEELGSLVVEAKLPEIGQLQGDSYEGVGFIIVRHPETAVVEDALSRLACDGARRTGRITSAYSSAHRVRKLLQEHAVGLLRPLEAAQAKEFVRGMELLVLEAKAKDDGIGSQRAQEDVAGWDARAKARTIWRGVVQLGQHNLGCL